MKSIQGKESIRNLYTLNRGQLLLINKSQHYYIIQRFNDDEDLWNIDPISDSPSFINKKEEQAMWTKISNNNPKSTQVFEISIFETVTINAVYYYCSIKKTYQKSKALDDNKLKLNNGIFEKESTQKKPYRIGHLKKFGRKCLSKLYMVSL
jgi:hypothetical protein